MRPALKTREFLSQYQQKLKPDFSSCPVGLKREIKPSRQASDTFDAADYFNIIRTSSIVVVGCQENKTEFDRLGKNLKVRSILGLEFPEVTLPLALGRNMAVLVGAATRNHLLQITGYNATQDFITLQSQALAQDSATTDLSSRMNTE